MAEAISVPEGAELPAGFQGNVDQAVRALLKLTEIRKKGGSEKLNLLADDEEAQPVFVQISLKHIPEVRGGISLRNKQLTVSNLPHSWYNDKLSVCLFVADVPGSKSDREKTVRHWKEVLESSGVSCVNQLVSARSIRTEYHTFEARRQLACAFDTFLMDKRLRMRSQQWLGSSFFARGRVPICVRLNKHVENDDETKRGLQEMYGVSSDNESEAAKWIPAEFSRAFRTATLPLSVKGPCSNAIIGYTSMSEQQLAENAAAFFAAILRKLPGGLENVRAAHLKSKTTRAVPFFLSTAGNLTAETLSAVRQFEQRLTDRAEFRSLKRTAEIGAPKRSAAKRKNLKQPQRKSSTKTKQRKTSGTEKRVVKSEVQKVNKVTKVKSSKTSRPLAKKRKV